MAQHSAEELREKHCQVVEAFRAARPVNVYGQRIFVVSKDADPLTRYVCANAHHHVKNGVCVDNELDSKASTEWLGDVPQDSLVLCVGNALGIGRLSKLAESAEAAGDWWLAARYWAVIGVVSLTTDGNSKYVSDMAIKSLDAIEKFKSSKVSASTLDKVHQVQLMQFRRIAMIMDSRLAERAEEAYRVCRTSR